MLNIRQLLYKPTLAASRLIYFCNKNMGSTTDLKIIHDPQNCCFSLQLPSSSEKAVVLYANEPDGSVRLYHTEVPHVFRGKGVAKAISKEALDYFAAKNTKMLLTCSYLQKFAAENPDPKYKDVIINYIQSDDF